jgi:hypothetical protein
MVAKEQTNDTLESSLSPNNRIQNDSKSNTKISPLVLLAQTCNNIGKEFLPSTTTTTSRSSSSFKNSYYNNMKKITQKPIEIGNKNLLSLEKMSNRINNSLSINTNITHRPPSTTSSSSSSSSTNEQHNFTSKIITNKTNQNRNKPYSTPNKTPSPSSSSNSSLTTSPTISYTPPTIPQPTLFDPLVLATIQKYYATLAATQQQNYEAYSNSMLPLANTNCPDPNCSKCQSVKNENVCTIPGCTQCIKHLNTSQQNYHSCNWLSGGNIYCGKKFSTLDQLNDHIKTHTTAELASDLTRYYNIRSSLLNSNTNNQNTPLVQSSNLSSQLHSNRSNPYLKPNSNLLPQQYQPYLLNQSNLPMLAPNLNFYSQLAMLTNNM